jgi:purine-binding chemotaxis protein CheW
VKPTVKPTHILQHQLALDVYLSTLLEEIPDAVLDEAIPVEKEPVFSEKIAESERPELLAVPLSVSVPGEKALTRERLHVNAPLATPIQPLSLMPEWSRVEFQALFFKIDQMVFASPLLTLSRTLVFDRKLTKLPTQPAWFLGLLDSQGLKVGILDGGQLIFGKAKGAQRDLNTRPFSNLLISANGAWLVTKCYPLKNYCRRKSVGGL